VEDPAVPNQERIIFRPTDRINLVRFAIVVGFRNDNGLITVINDNCFWFDEIEVAPPSWVVIYTKQGQATQGLHAGNPVYFRYWGRKQTIFNILEFIPVLIRVSAVTIGGHLKPVPSYKTLLSQGPA
jgi:hypothetical protein